MLYDVLVIGSGPAGLSAGVYAGRCGLDAVLFEKESIGGELVNRHSIDDFPGVPDASGPELRSTLVDQLGQYDVSITLTAVEAIHDDDPFRVTTADGEYRGRTVLVASGGRPTRLDDPDEERYRGRGVFYCAMCDGPLYADEVVAVSGSDDWALTDALYLTEFASKVIVIEEGAELAGGETLRKRVRSHPDIEVSTRTEIGGVEGDDVVQRLRLIDTEDGTERVEAVGGLYVQHGIEPESSYLSDVVPTTDCGAVIVDQSLETETPGIFAAGDVRQSSPRTVAAAIGDGITACRSARRRLESTE